jgi:uncharacterized metal-binding protein
MPNGKPHRKIGTVVGAISSVSYAHFIEQDSDKAWQYAIGGSIGGYALSTIADILEPANILGPNHRGLIHGVAFNGGLVHCSYDKIITFLIELVNKARDYDLRGELWMAFMCRCAVGAIVGAIAGHTSHLLADLATPKGLPAIC